MSARAAAAAAALLVIVTSCSSQGAATKHRQEQPPTTTPAGATTPTADAAPPRKNGLQVQAERHAAAQRILSARARAVRTHDEAAWLAPLDPADTGLVRRETRLFDNLQRLPLQTFSLRANEEWTWPEDFAGEEHRATAYLPYVEQTMRLRGFDPEPVTAVYTYTFAEVDGETRIVSDDDVTDQEGLSSGTLPWDVASIRVHRTAHALGIFDTGSDKQHERLMRAAEASVSRVRAAVPSRWPGKVVFYAISDEELLRGMGEKYLDAGAVAFPVGDHSMWWDHVAATRVIMNPRYLPRSDTEADYILTHEVTHVAMARVSGTVPTWVEEGLAEYVAGGGRAARSWEPLGVSVYAAGGVTALPGSTFFGDDTPELDYDLSHAALLVLARLRGDRAMWRFVDRLSRADTDGDRESHLDAVLKRSYGLTADALAHRAARLILDQV